MGRKVSQHPRPEQRAATHNPAGHHEYPVASVMQRLGVLGSGCHVRLHDLEDEEVVAADQRRVVELHYLRGLAVADVAAEIGRSRPAAVGLLFRGLKRLRELLKDTVESGHES